MSLDRLSCFCETTDVRFDPKVGEIDPKVGEIDPKWDKSVTFSDQISVHFGSSQNVLKSDLKRSRICPIRGQSDPLWYQNMASVVGASEIKTLDLPVRPG